jgi:hypothetical protein
MPFPANVLTVMIAAPAGIGEEHGIVADELYRWNHANAIAQKLLLHPIRWAGGAAAQNGAFAYAPFDSHDVDNTDLLIGIFNVRSHTLSEERLAVAIKAIKRHVAAGKTARVYFSEAAIPQDSSAAGPCQILSSFREECRNGGLSITYDCLETFQGLFRQHLFIELSQPRYMWLSEPVSASQTSEFSLSVNATRMLIAAEAAQGIIAVAPAAGGEVIRIGHETLSDGTPRTTAVLKEAMQELRTHDYIEPMGGRPGNYSLTASGYRVADKILENHPDAGSRLKAEPVPFEITAGKTGRM